MRRRRWVWVLIFIVVTGLLVTLATSWNVVLVQNYRRMLEVARALSFREPPPWVGTILGTLGFVTVVTGVGLMFWRLFQEMRLNQIQAEFLARVSHELKTPIATIELTSSMLRAKLASGGGHAGPESPDTLADINKLWKLHDSELSRLKIEVEALLEAARLEANPQAVSPQRLDLEEWIDSASRRWKDILGPNAVYERKGERLPFPAVVDPKLMELVANNLVDNARKFARENRPALTVVTRTIPPSRPGRPPRWQLRFEDSGCGFPPGASKRIFKRFHREKTLQPHAVPGTGLGLYLSKQAARAIGVKLYAESAGPGKGSAFILEGDFTA